MGRDSGWRHLKGGHHLPRCIAWDTIRRWNPDHSGNAVTSPGKGGWGSLLCLLLGDMVDHGGNHKDRYEREVAMVRCESKESGKWPEI